MREARHAPTLKTLPDLTRFVGSETIFHHPLDVAVRYSEGVRFLADEVGGHWLLDKIAASQSHVEAVAAHPLQVWDLRLARCRGTLVCEDVDGRVIHTEAIAFSDFPSPGIKLVVLSGLIMLEREMPVPAGAAA